MNKIEKQEILTNPVTQTTSVLLLDGDNVLLGIKKRGFATGKWNGFGGKKKDDETIEETADREVREEAGIKVRNLVQQAVLNCHHPGWTQEVNVYTTSEWEGTPEESDEMRPRWFPRDEIPYDQMWADAAIVLPLILEGKKLKANFYFDEHGTLLNTDNPAITLVETFE